MHYVNNGVAQLVLLTFDERFILHRYKHITEGESMTR